MARTDELDRRLLDTLAAHDGPAGICPRVPRLAKLLGVSVSTIQRSLGRLEAAGLVERIPVYERDDDLEWKQRQAAGFTGEAPRRQTSNSYRVTPGPGVTPKAETAGHPPVSRLVRDTPERGDLSTPPVGGTTPAHDDGDSNGDTGVEFTRVDLTGADVDRLDRAPGVGKILSTITAGLGDARVLEVRWNDGRHPAYPIRGGREVDLEACSAEDLHRALDQLDRDTCWDGPCPKGCSSRCPARCPPGDHRQCARNCRHCHRHRKGGAR
jgi:DNA-binding Lrp family transcriptional regulator